MVTFTSYVVDNDKRFQKALQEAKKQVSDLRVPLTIIAKNWFKGNKAIFQLTGKGKFTDLSESYKKRKAKPKAQGGAGFIYPILKFGGRLEDSITNPTSPDAVSEIINKDTLIMGSRVPYGIYHQSSKPRKTKLPQRRFIFISDSQAERYVNEINAYVMRKVAILGKVNV